LQPLIFEEEKKKERVQGRAVNFCPGQERRGEGREKRRISPRELLAGKKKGKGVSKCGGSRGGGAKKFLGEKKRQPETYLVPIWGGRGKKGKKERSVEPRLGEGAKKDRLGKKEEESCPTLAQELLFSVGGKKKEGGERGPIRPKDSGRTGGRERSLNGGKREKIDSVIKDYFKKGKKKSGRGSLPQAQKGEKGGSWDSKGGGVL